MHISFHLIILMDHKPLIVLNQISIDEPLWGNHTHKYGAPGMTMPGMAPIYTNHNSGLIKIVSLSYRNIH